MKRALSLALAAGAIVIATPLAAMACVQPAPLPLEEVLETGENVSQRPVVGIHEQRHIARIPGVPVLVNERSASVVTRYWGEEPNLSVASHGDEGIYLLTVTSCGTPARPLGHETLHANDIDDLERTRHSYSYVFAADRSGLSEAEAASLAARFGPAVEVSLGPDDYIIAWALLLWRPLITFGTVGLIGYGAVRRARGLTRNQSQLDGPIAAAAFLGVTGIVLVEPSYGLAEWIGLVAATAGSLCMAWLLRVPWVALSIGYVAYFAIRPDPLFVGLGDTGDRRLQAAVGGLIIAIGSLAWSRRHWSRFVSSAVIVASSFFLVLGLADTRGYVNMPKTIALALLVTAAVAFAVWWLAFQERRLNSGAPAEPPDEDRTQ